MHGVSEMLMRQLLKLDGVEADGDAKAMRRAEVCFILVVYLQDSHKPIMFILFTCLSNHLLCLLNIHLIISSYFMLIIMWFILIT